MKTLYFGEIDKIELTHMVYYCYLEYMGKEYALPPPKHVWSRLNKAIEIRANGEVPDMTTVGFSLTAVVLLACLRFQFRLGNEMNRMSLYQVSEIDQDVTIDRWHERVYVGKHTGV